MQPGAMTCTHAYTPDIIHGVSRYNKARGTGPMERNAYTAELHSILKDAHALTMRLHGLIDALGNTRCAEYQMLAMAVRFAGGTSGMLYDALYPDESGLELEPEPEPDGVDVVCVACRKPAEPISPSYPEHAHGWQHATQDDAVACPELGNPVRVMVAAGAENVPNPYQGPPGTYPGPSGTDSWDLTKPALSAGPLDV